METSNKQSPSSQGKLIQYREQSNLAFMLLIKSQLLEEPLNLDELMRYSLTPVPPSLCTPDVFPPKLTKPPCYTFCWFTPPKRCPTQEMLSTSRMVWVSCICSPIYLRHSVTFAFRCCMDCMASFIFSTMQTLSRHRRDCAVASHRPTSSIAQPLEGLWTSSYSWLMKKTSDSSVGCCSGPGGAKWQLHDLISVGQQLPLWMGRHISWTRAMVK